MRRHTPLMIKFSVAIVASLTIVMSILDRGGLYCMCMRGLHDICCPLVLRLMIGS